jgi:hypothetical protein
MVCAAITQQYKILGKIVLIDDFYGADKVSKSNFIINYFYSLEFYDSKVKYLLSQVGNREISRIFIDSDFGIKNNLMLFMLKLFNWKLEVNVYEEGNGVYRNDLIGSSYKSFFYKILGLKGYLGGSFFVKKIYVLDQDRYKSSRPEMIEKIMPVGVLFSLWIKENIDILKLIFGSEADKFKIPKDFCAIYITNWEIDFNIIKYLSGNQDFFLIKPHPHIKNIECISGYNIIDPGIPVEIALIEILDFCDSIYVYHSGSSSLEYIKNKKIKLFNINDFVF